MKFVCLFTFYNVFYVVGLWPSPFRTKLAGGGKPKTILAGRFDVIALAPFQRRVGGVVVDL